MNQKYWYARNDVDVLECDVYQVKLGGGITLLDTFENETKALKYLIKELADRMRMEKKHLAELKYRLKLATTDTRENEK